MSHALNPNLLTLPLKSTQNPTISHHLQSCQPWSRTITSVLGYFNSLPFGLLHHPCPLQSILNPVAGGMLLKRPSIMSFSHSNSQTALHLPQIKRQNPRAGQHGYTPTSSPTPLFFTRSSPAGLLAVLPPYFPISFRPLLQCLLTKVILQPCILSLVTKLPVPPHTSIPLLCPTFLLSSSIAHHNFLYSWSVSPQRGQKCHKSRKLFHCFAPHRIPST